MSAYKIIDDFIEKYINNPYDTIRNMKNYYDNEDEYWFIIGYLLDIIKNFKEDE